jgi:hypothetical protein
MAIAVIGGIIVSTVLSLVVVPSFFLIMDDLSRLLGRTFGRFVGKKEEEEVELSAEELARRQRQSAQSLAVIDERLSRVERQTNANANAQASDASSGASASGNVLRLPPMAAE